MSDLTREWLTRIAESSGTCNIDHRYRSLKMLPAVCRQLLAAMEEKRDLRFVCELLATAAESGVCEDKDFDEDSLVDQTMRRINSARDANIRKGMDAIVELHGLEPIDWDEVGRLRPEGAPKKFPLIELAERQ